MAQEEKVLDHNFDGIQEYDNPLPRWWVWLFYITIIFSVIYVPYYHLFGGMSSSEEYAAEIAIVEKIRAEQEKAAAASKPSEAAIAEKSESPAAAPVSVEAGKSIYTTNCIACHGQLGEGGIGPNLTDDYWLHGNTETDLTKIVTEGVVAKGMIAWKTVLSPSKIRDVVAYIQTLKGTNPPNAKAPQGEKY